MTGRTFTDDSGWVGVCPSTGKRMYSSKGMAKRAVRRMHGDGLRAYRCDGHWHIGHMPVVARQGRSGVWTRHHGGGS